MSLFMISEIRGLFVNSLTADNKYSLPNTDNLRQAIQIQLSKNKKLLYQFFCVSEIYIKL